MVSQNKKDNNILSRINDIKIIKEKSNFYAGKLIPIQANPDRFNLLVPENFNAKIENGILKIENENSLIFCIKKPIRLPIKYKFASFFALNTVKSLCLKGFKYELANYDLELYDSLCISNEIICCDNLVSFKEGLLLIILSNDDH